MKTLKEFLDSCSGNIIEELKKRKKEFNTTDVVFQITQCKELQEEYIKLSEQYGSYNKLNAQIGRYLLNNMEKLGICKNGEKEVSQTITGRQSRTQKWKFLLIPVLVLFLSMSIYAQETLPKGAKLKTISYPSYKIEGYVLKDLFVENQTITIQYNSGRPMIRGKLIVQNGNAYIDGIYKEFSPYSDNETLNIQGLFKVSNKQNEIRLTPNKKEAYKLSIKVKDFTSCTVSNVFGGDTKVYNKSDYNFSNKEWEQIFNDTKNIDDLSKNIDIFYQKKQQELREEENRQRKLREEKERIEKEEKIKKEKEEKEAHLEMLIEEIETVLDNDYYSADCHSVETLEELKKQLQPAINDLKKLQGTPAFFSEMEKMTYLLELQTALSNAIIAQKLTKKYGAATAKKIMSGNLEVGMSVTIVEEILGINKQYYKKSISTVAGKRLEMWQFDYNAEALRIFTIDVKRNLDAECPTLMFTDGKLTDIIR